MLDNAWPLLHLPTSQPPTQTDAEQKLVLALVQQTELHSAYRAITNTISSCYYRRRRLASVTGCQRGSDVEIMKSKYEREREKKKTGCLGFAQNPVLCA